LIQLANILSNKETIARRILQTAVKHWEVKDANEDSFDPLVKLLLEALAVELARVDSELLNLQQKVAQQISGMLLPDVKQGPVPAHAIVQATSNDASMYTNTDLQLVYTKRVASVPNGPLNKSIDIHFAPAGRYKTINAQLKYIAHGNQLYLSKGLYREPVASAHNYLPSNQLWIGIESNYFSDIDFSNLPIFFDLRSNEDKYRILNALKHAKCKIANLPINMESGLNDIEDSLHLQDGLPNNYQTFADTQFENDFANLYLNVQNYKKVQAIYNNYFLRLPNTKDFKKLPDKIFGLVPPEIKNAFGNQGSINQEKLLWIKFELPPVFNESILSSLTVAINCFPVLNQKLYSVDRRLNNAFNIVPLTAEEQFLSINNVNSAYEQDAESKYAFYAFDRYTESDKGIYAVRLGDVSRFDTRNASQMIDYLIELLRDESRAFEAMGNDYLDNSIKIINQHIELIAQKLNQSSDAVLQSPAYLLINPLKDGDRVSIEYWCTNGEVGNGIKVASELSLYKGSDFVKQGIILMTPSIGGSNKPNQTELLNAFKSSLISRDRLVTPADVKHFCIDYLRDKLVGIKVSRAVVMSDLPTEGLVPAVKLDIQVNKNLGIEAEEWNDIKNELNAVLKTKSSIETNYFIVLN
jgi:hypothetical protein